VPDLLEVYAKKFEGLTGRHGQPVSEFFRYLYRKFSIMTESQIRQLLGGTKVLGSSKDLNHLAEEGLPKQSLVIFMKKINLDERRLFSYLDVTRRALDNYKPNERLRLYVSDRLIHLAELYVKGKELFDSFENFNEWLNRPSIDLGGEKPLERIHTRKGVDDLIHVLGRIEHGILA
jgi:putative toxin-antitoxin system antitoxin component (TIGR02293 family)